jgi:zinc/manganese transport system substrate-binding protein
MKQMVPALIEALEEATNTDLSAAADELTLMFESSHTEVLTIMDSLGDVPCTLVTGHESMRYFADRYGCDIVGAIIPGLSSTAEATAGALADLKEKAVEAQVRAIFVDEGTPSKVADQIASEVGVEVHELASHTVPDEGGYMAYVVAIADVIVDGLTAE